MAAKLVIRAPHGHPPLAQAARGDNTKPTGLLLELHVVAFADDNLDRTFGALAHPIRRAILTRLAREGSASVSDLAEPFDVSLMAVSKHLKVMEQAGLIRREKDGRVHRCSYDPKSIAEASAWIEMHRRFWTQQLDSLAAYLEGPGARTSERSDHGGRGGGGGRLPHTRGEDS